MRKNLPYIYLITFITAAFILLPVMNGDYLFTIQENSVFIKGHTFMQDVVGQRGGWPAWVACYLTQFFYHPWVGSSIIIAMWVTIYLLTLHLFSISKQWSPVALILPAVLLFNLLDYGYWIYYAKTPGFAFLPTLLCLAFLLCTFLILLLLKRISLDKHIEKAMPFIVCIIIAGLCLTVFYKPQQVSFFNNHQCSVHITLGDDNFRHELKMYRALDEGRYNDIIEEMQQCSDEPTNLMVLFKNIALMHTDRLTDMFKINNCGVQPQSGDSLQVHISVLAAPLVYYQFGQINYAYRWAMENAVEYGLSVRNLKMMARAAIFNQDFDVAMKYLTLLKATNFYRDWAMEHEAWILNSTLFVQSQDYQAIAPLMGEDNNALDYDQGLCEKYLLEHFSDLRHPTSTKLEDVIMCFSLWTEDTYAFSVQFYDYVQRHRNQPIPILYQEGAILLCHQEDSPITLGDFPFDDVVANKYNRFVQDYNQLSQQGLSQKDMAQRLKAPYGDTYWWFYYFYTDFNIY